MYEQLLKVGKQQNRSVKFSKMKFKSRFLAITSFVNQRGELNKALHII